MCNRLIVLSCSMHSILCRLYAHLRTEGVQTPRFHSRRYRESPYPKIAPSFHVSPRRRVPGVSLTYSRAFWRRIERSKAHLNSTRATAISSSRRTGSLSLSLAPGPSSRSQMGAAVCARYASTRDASLVQRISASTWYMLCDAGIGLRATVCGW